MPSSVMPSAPVWGRPKTPCDPSARFFISLCGSTSHFSVRLSAHYLHYMGIMQVAMAVGSDTGNNTTRDVASYQLRLDSPDAADNAPTGSCQLEPPPSPRPSGTPGARRRDVLLTWLRENGGALFNEGTKQYVALRGRVTDLTPGDALLEYILTEAIGISSAHREAKDAVHFLRAWVLENAISVTRAALSFTVDDRIYLPSLKGLLRVTPSAVSIVPSIYNEDHVWVSHPNERPFEVDPDSVSDHCREGLLAIEETIMKSQSVRTPSMAWFTTINGLLAPFLRQRFGAKFITVHVGPSQSGKTTAAQLLLDALNLGAVTGDATSAGLHAQDTGLQVLDNLETGDWRPELVQFALHSATGASRLRSSRNGRALHHQNGALLFITSIEGVPRVELRSRCATIEFRKPAVYLSRGDATRAVVTSRRIIHAAIVGVLQRFLRQRPTPTHTRALANFGEHYAAVRDLLFCIGEMLGRPDRWASEIAAEWDTELSASESEERTNDELEELVIGATRRLPDSIPYSLTGTPGRLFVTSATQLAALMGGNQGAAALSRRLRGSEFKEIRVLTGQDVNDLPDLRRTSTSRRLGIFVPGQGTVMTAAPPFLRQVDVSAHPYLPPECQCHFIWNYGSPGTDPALLTALKQPLDQVNLGPRFLMVLDELTMLLRRLAPSHWANTVFCVMPNAGGKPTQLERVMQETGLGRTIPLLRFSERMAPRAKAIPPDELASCIYTADVAGPISAEHTIVIVDDVLSTGAHFAAAASVLHRSYPSASIVGLFIFCNSRRPPNADGASDRSLPIPSAASAVALDDAPHGSLDPAFNASSYRLPGMAARGIPHR